MIEQAVQRLLKNPRRWVIVITVTCGLGLVTLLPLADEYLELILLEGELTAQLNECQLLAARLDQLGQRTQAQLASLRQVEARAVNDERLNQFRGEVVSWVREAGCSLRRISVNEPLKRPWLRDDDPREQRNRGKSDKDQTGYELSVQPLTLSISGRLPEVKTMLAQLHAQRILGHLVNCSLQPTTPGGDEMVLDLEFWLYDLRDGTHISI